MAIEKGFTSIDFSRLKDLVKFPFPEKLTEIAYVANATNFRRFLLDQYGKKDLDIDHEIGTEPDTLMTYRGYQRFLQSDLQYMFPTGKNRTRHGYKREVKFLAKEMLIRGYVSSTYNCPPREQHHCQFALAEHLSNRLSPGRSKAPFQIIYGSPSINLQASTRCP